MYNKTDMFTPEQYNMEKHPKNYIDDNNCIKFGVGNPEIFITPYWFDDAGRAFEKKATETIGFSLKKVDSLKDLDGKTGFIVYGFVATYNGFGELKKEGYHVVRVNSDGSIVHVPDIDEPAEYITDMDEQGKFSGPYAQLDKDMISFYELVEEKNKDTTKLEERKSRVLSRLLQSSFEGSQNGGELVSQIGEIKRILDSSEHLNSSDINILIQRATMLAKEHNIEKEEKEDREVGE